MPSGFEISSMILTLNQFNFNQYQNVALSSPLKRGYQTTNGLAGAPLQ